MKLKDNVITVEAVKALNAMQGGDRWTILRALGTTNTYVHVTDSVAAEQPLEEEALLKDVLKRVEKIKHNSKYYRLYIDEERDGAYERRLCNAIHEFLYAYIVLNSLNSSFSSWTVFKKLLSRKCNGGG